MQTSSRHDTLRALALFACLCALAACDDDPIRPDPDPDPEPLPAVASTVVIDSLGPLTRSLVIQLDAPARAEVFYAPVDAGGRVFRMRADSVALRHEILMPRLFAESGYVYATRAYDDAAAADSITRGSFSTGALPTQLTELEYTIEGHATFPVVIIPLRATTSGWAGQVAIDTEGGIVWYYPVGQTALAATRIPGSHDILFIENGLTVDTEPDGLIRLAPDGRVVARLERDESLPFSKIHHDLVAVDAERVLFIANNDAMIGDTLVVGESIWEWNMTTGAVAERWNVFDFLDWNTDRIGTPNPNNWLHANSISIGPRGNVVVSFRGLNQVISIAADFQSIEWRIGGPNATHGIAEQDRFVGQHSAWELAGGRLLLFDNRGGGPDSVEHSRALELQIHADTVTRILEYDPGIQAPLRGGVYRLENGNTVTSFPALPFIVDETTPTGERIWRLTGDRNFTPAFRGVPWPSMAGEVRVETMP